MFFTPAFAQTAGGDSGSQLQTLMQYLPIVLVMVVFYFLLIRPQQQRTKQLKAAQSALRRGDKVVTAGGIIASVSRVINDEEVELTLAENVKVRVVRSTINTVLSKTEPAKGEAVKPDSDSAPPEAATEKKRTGNRNSGESA